MRPWDLFYREDSEDVPTRIRRRKADPGQKVDLEALWARLNRVPNDSHRKREFKARDDVRFLETHFSEWYLRTVAIWVMRENYGRLDLGEWHAAVRSDHAAFMIEVEAYFAEQRLLADAEASYRQRLAEEERRRAEHEDRRRLEAEKRDTLAARQRDPEWQSERKRILAALRTSRVGTKCSTCNEEVDDLNRCGCPDTGVFKA